MQAIVQFRGGVNTAQGVRDMLTMPSIHRMNYATLVPETDAYRGVISKVSDFVMHNEPNVDVVGTLISTRAEPEEGDGDITDKWVSRNTDYGDVAALAQAIIDEETALREQGVSSVVCSHLPRDSHRRQKHVTKEGDQLGKHGTEQIGELLEDMR